MEGHINNQELLRINRGDKWVASRCHMSTEDRLCTDQCPLFGEPYMPEISRDSYIRKLKPNMIYLELCHKTLIFDNFTDQRI